MQSAGQMELFPFQNPLTERFGRDFFLSLPQMPGVYIFRDADGEILYVGKAKNLKQRLNSYRQIKPLNASKKQVRLVGQIAKIDWLPADSEIDALLQENLLISKRKPEYNRVNKNPEYYFYLHEERQNETVRYWLSQEIDHGASVVLGTFKSKLRTSEKLAMLFETYHYLISDRPRFRSTQMHSGRRQFVVPYHELEHRFMRQFLLGESTDYLDRLGQALRLEPPACGLTAFQFTQYQQELADLYKVVLLPMAEIKKAFQLRIIDKLLLDDLKVMMNGFDSEQGQAFPVLDADAENFSEQ